MNRLFLLLVFMAYTLFTFSSYATESSSSTDDELFLLGKKLCNTNPDSSLSIAHLLKQRALESGDNTMLAHSNYIKGKSLFMKDKLEEALTSLYKSASAYQKENEFVGLSNSLQLIGVCHNYLNSYQYALDNHFEELEYRLVLNNQESISYCYYNIARNYSYVNEYDSAIAYIEKSLDIAQKLDLNDNIPYCYYELGTYYYEKGMYQEASKKYSEAEVLAKSIGHDVLIAALAKAKGNLYLKQHKLDQAEEQFLIAINSKEFMSDKRKAIYTYNCIARLYEAKQEYPKVEQYYTLISQLDKEKTDVLLQKEVLGELYTRYVTSNEVQKSQETGLQIVALNKYTAVLEENNEKLHNMYKAERIKILFENSELQNEVKDQKHQINIMYVLTAIIVIGLIAIIIVAITTYRTMKSHEGLIDYLKERDRLLRDLRQHRIVNFRKAAKILMRANLTKPYDDRILI